MVLIKFDSIYEGNIPINPEMINNRLFATFTPLENLDFLLENLISNYTIIYNKIFVLSIEENNDLICTYNVDSGNINNIPSNTILVHRKKDTNTLYSINALNKLIKQLNGGVMDSKYIINWNDYKNSILLTQHDNFKKLKTKIYKIIEV